MARKGFDQYTVEELHKTKQTLSIIKFIELGILISFASFLIYAKINNKAVSPVFIALPFAFLGAVIIPSMKIKKINHELMSRGYHKP